MSFNLALVLSRRPVAASALASRRHSMFYYPHSYSGTNTAFTDLPSKNMYPEIDRNAAEGTLAPYAHQNVREFPDWYKPYNLNYLGHGWLAFFIFSVTLFGWRYLNDIKQWKGRKQRKKYPILREDTQHVAHYKNSWVRARLEKGDPEWTKFLTRKERATPHH